MQNTRHISLTRAMNNHSYYAHVPYKGLLSLTTAVMIWASSGSLL